MVESLCDFVWQGLLGNIILSHWQSQKIFHQFLMASATVATFWLPLLTEMPADHSSSLFFLWQGHRWQVECISGTAGERYERGVSRVLLCSTRTNVLLSSSDALDELQLKRYCCRRMVLTHVDLIEKLLHYNRSWHLAMREMPSLTYIFSDGTHKGQDYWWLTMLPPIFLILCVLMNRAVFDRAFHRVIDIWAEPQSLSIVLIFSGPIRLLH